MMMKKKNWFSVVCWIVLFSFCAQLIPQSAVAQTYLFPNPVNEKSFPIKDLGIFSENLGGAALGVDLPKAGETPFVFLISEAHANAAFQKQIVRILERIDAQFGLDAIFVEGTDEKLLTAPFGQIQDKTNFKQFLDAYLNKGELTGAEYFSLAHKKGALEIFGTEEPRLYQSSLEAMKRIYRAHEKWNKIKNELKEQVDAEKVSFSKPVDELFEIYKTHFRSSQEFDLDEGIAKIEKLIQEWAPSKNAFARMAEKYQELIGFSKASAWLNQARQVTPEVVAKKVSQLLPYLTQSQKIALVQILVEAKENDQGNVFYQRLFDFLKGADLNEVPVSLKEPLFHDLKLVLDIPEALNKNLADVFIQLHHLKWDAALCLAQSEREKEYLQKTNLLFWLNRLVELKITSYEWKEFFDSGVFFLSWDKNVELKTAQSHLLLKGMIQDALSFYEAAQARDLILSANLIEKANGLSRGSRVVALVVGGFHEKGVAKTLDRFGIRYASILPYPDALPSDSEEIYKKLILEQDFLAPKPVLSPSNPRLIEFENGLFQALPTEKLNLRAWEAVKQAKETEESLSSYFEIKESHQKINSPEQALTLSLENWVERSASNYPEMLLGIHKRVFLYKQLSNREIALPRPQQNWHEVLSSLKETTENERLKSALGRYFELASTLKEAHEKQIEKNIASISDKILKKPKEKKVKARLFALVTVFLFFALSLASCSKPLGTSLTASVPEIATVEIAKSTPTTSVSSLRGEFAAPYGGVRVVAIDREFGKKDEIQTVQPGDLLVGLEALPTGLSYMESIANIDAVFKEEKLRIQNLLNLQLNRESALFVVQAPIEGVHETVEQQIEKGVASLQAAEKRWEDKKKEIEAGTAAEFDLMALSREVRMQFSQLEELLVERYQRRVFSTKEARVERLLIQENEILKKGAPLFHYSLPKLKTITFEDVEARLADYILGYKNAIHLYQVRDGKREELTSNIIQTNTNIPFERGDIWIPYYDVTFVIEGASFEEGTDSKFEVKAENVPASLVKPVGNKGELFTEAKLTVVPKSFSLEYEGAICWSPLFLSLLRQTKFSNEAVLGSAQSNELLVLRKEGLLKVAESFQEEAKWFTALSQDAASLYGASFSDPKTSGELLLSAGNLRQQANLLSKEEVQILAPKGWVQPNLFQISNYPTPNQPLFYYLSEQDLDHAEMILQTYVDVSFVKDQKVTLVLPHGQTIQGVVYEIASDSTETLFKIPIKQIKVRAALRSEDFPNGLPDFGSGARVSLVASATTTVHDAAAKTPHPLFFWLLGFGGVVLAVVTYRLIKIRKFERDYHTPKYDTLRNFGVVLFCVALMGPAGCATSIQTQAQYEKEGEKISGPKLEERRQSVLKKELFTPTSLQNLTLDQAMRYAVLTSPELYGSLLELHEAYQRLQQSYLQDDRLNFSLGGSGKIQSNSTTTTRQFGGGLKAGVGSIGNSSITTFEGASGWGALLGGKINFNLNPEFFTQAALDVFRQKLTHWAAVEAQLRRVQEAYFYLGSAELELRQTEIVQQAAQNRLQVFEARDAKVVSAKELQQLRLELEQAEKARIAAQGKRNEKEEALRNVVAPGQQLPITLAQSFEFTLNEGGAQSFAAQLGETTAKNQTLSDLASVKKELAARFPQEGEEVNALADLESIRIYLEKKFLGTKEATRHQTLSVPSVSIPLQNPPAELSKQDRPETLAHENAVAGIESMIRSLRKQAETQASFSPQLNLNFTAGMAGITDLILGFLNFDLSIPLDTERTDALVRELELQLARFRKAALPATQNKLFHELKNKALEYETTLALLRQELKGWQRERDNLVLALNGLGKGIVDLATPTLLLRQKELAVSLRLLQLQLLWFQLESASGRLAEPAQKEMEKQIEQYEGTSGTGTKISLNGSLFDSWHAKGGKEAPYSDEMVDASLREQFDHSNMAPLGKESQNKLIKKLTSLIDTLEKENSFKEVAQILGLKTKEEIGQKIKEWVTQKTKIHFSHQDANSLFLMLTPLGGVRWQVAHIGFYQDQPSLYLSKNLFEKLSSSDAAEQRIVAALFFYEFFKLEKFKSKKNLKALSEEGREKIQQEAEALERLVAGQSTESYYQQAAQKELGGVRLQAETQISEPVKENAAYEKLFKELQELKSVVSEKVKTPLSSSVDNFESFSKTWAETVSKTVALGVTQAIQAIGPSSKNDEKMTQILEQQTTILKQMQKENRQESAKADVRAKRNERENQLIDLANKFQDHSFFIEKEKNNFPNKEDFYKVLEYTGISKKIWLASLKHALLKQKRAKYDNDQTASIPVIISMYVCIILILGGFAETVAMFLFNISPTRAFAGIALHELMHVSLSTFTNPITFIFICVGLFVPLALLWIPFKVMVVHHFAWVFISLSLLFRYEKVKAFEYKMGLNEDFPIEAYVREYIGKPSSNVKEDEFLLIPFKDNFAQPYLTRLIDGLEKAKPSISAHIFSLILGRDVRGESGDAFEKLRGDALTKVNVRSGGDPLAIFNNLLEGGLSLAVLNSVAEMTEAEKTVYVAYLARLRQIDPEIYRSYYAAKERRKQIKWFSRIKHFFDSTPEGISDENRVMLMILFMGSISDVNLRKEKLTREEKLEVALLRSVLTQFSRDEKMNWNHLVSRSLQKLKTEEILPKKKVPTVSKVVESMISLMKKTELSKEEFHEFEQNRVFMKWARKMLIPDFQAVKVLKELLPESVWVDYDYKLDSISSSEMGYPPISALVEASVRAQEALELDVRQEGLEKMAGADTVFYLDADLFSGPYDAQRFLKPFLEKTSYSVKLLAFNEEKSYFYARLARELKEKLNGAAKRVKIEKHFFGYQGGTNKKLMVAKENFEKNPGIQAEKMVVISNGYFKGVASLLLGNDDLRDFSECSRCLQQNHIPITSVRQVFENGKWAYYFASVTPERKLTPSDFSYDSIYVIVPGGSAPSSGLVSDATPSPDSGDGEQGPVFKDKTSPAPKTSKEKEKIEALKPLAQKFFEENKSVAVSVEGFVGLVNRLNQNPDADLNGVAQELRNEKELLVLGKEQKGTIPSAKEPGSSFVGFNGQTSKLAELLKIQKKKPLQVREKQLLSKEVKNTFTELLDDEIIFEKRNGNETYYQAIRAIENVNSQTSLSLTAETATDLIQKFNEELKDLLLSLQKTATLPQSQARPWTLYLSEELLPKIGSDFLIQNINAYLAHHTMVDLQVQVKSLPTAALLTQKFEKDSLMVLPQNLTHLGGAHRLVIGVTQGESAVASPVALITYGISLSYLFSRESLKQIEAQEEIIARNRDRIDDFRQSLLVGSLPQEKQLTAEKYLQLFKERDAQPAPFKQQFEWFFDVVFPSIERFDPKKLLRLTQLENALLLAM